MKKILSLAIVMATLLALVPVPVNTGHGFSLEAEFGTTKDKAPYQSTDNFAPLLLKKEVVEEAPAKAPTAAATFDGLAVLAVVAALSGAGVVVCKRK